MINFRKLNTARILPHSNNFPVLVIKIKSVAKLEGGGRYVKHNTLKNGRLMRLIYTEHNFTRRMSAITQIVSESSKNILYYRL